ncbi:acetate--CoA ligase [Nevskia sp.]|uniref:acetate--CoA ligase n=1 Tax=Nevskia sp. TaxID=1929292 RepID=UPI0025F681AB|nr:acetate--CoA ligase [Nevskia sp.]
MSSDNFQSVLTETRVFPPSAAFAAAATVNAAKMAALRAAAAEDYQKFWGDFARDELSWAIPFKTVLDDSAAPNYRWFHDGSLNASYNCLDRHLATKGDKIAIRYEGEKGDTRTYSYRELHAEVCKLANAIAARGIVKGDRVVLYLPHSPEAVIAMQACARLGVTHSVVFGGFSATALRDRIEDTGAKLVITADGNQRGGNIVDLKKAVDEALALGCPSVDGVIVAKRTGHAITMKDGRDAWWHEAIANLPATCEPVMVEAEHPLFLLYTSGSTGKPKGIQHCTGGYLLGAMKSAQWVFDLKEDDLFWCTADVGWVTGHSYVTYGPLACGATVMIYEGVPTVPDAGRFWKICQDHGVTIFYTAPTAIRALMKSGEEFPNQYDLSKLRLLGSVGEPINPEAWMWYHRVIGKGVLPIVDTWWQTETGSIMMSPLPGATPTKPGSCTQPLPGLFADVVDEMGEPVVGKTAGGYLVITQPWPSMLRTIWGDNERYKKAYYGQFPARPDGSLLYVAGDSTYRDEDGYYWILGRTDDVLNVSGHRLGTMEVESALVSHPRVAEAAVVGRPHEIKGEAVCAFVICKGVRPTGDEAAALIKELREHVAKEIGPIAKPDDIRLADGLPKTRSGKIMRRLLRSIAKGEAITQDISTLENPAIVEQLAGKA